MVMLKPQKLGIGNGIMQAQVIQRLHKQPHLYIFFAMNEQGREEESDIVVE